MCGVIVVDAGRSRSTCHGRDAYIIDYCLGYLFDVIIFAVCLSRSNELWVYNQVYL